MPDDKLNYLDLFSGIQSGVFTLDLNKQDLNLTGVVIQKLINMPNKSIISIFQKVSI